MLSRFKRLAAELFRPDASPLSADDRLKSGDTVALCGDSITEMRYYSVFLCDYLTMCHARPVARVHQLGCSGEAAGGFLQRIDTEVLPFQPTVATVLYGMNDAGFRAGDSRTVSIFKNNLVDSIRKLQAGGVRAVVVGSPTPVDTERFKTWRAATCSPVEYNAALAGLGEAARAAAERTGAVYVDLHAIMSEVMRAAKAKYGNDYALAVDGVHSRNAGQIVIAYAFLKALGCDGEIGSIALDAQTGSATASAGHTVLEATSSRIRLRSSRYPFCFIDDPASEESTRAVLDLFPFNEDLNRFRLVVTQLPSPRAQVAWGGAAKIFTAEQLASGINLAAEFLDNPFHEAFGRVHALARRQQAFETPALKKAVRALQSYEGYSDEDKAGYALVKTTLVEKARALADEVRAAFVPVEHTLEISPLS
jgi:lysophospholipase L1-like esterase